MSVIPSRCPACQAELEVRQLACPQCRMHLEGQFALHPLLHLPPDDLAFVVRFVRASGSLKEMARHYGHSYPTIRNRLNEIIQRLAEGSSGQEAKRHQILDAIAKGELSVKEGAKRLKEVGHE